MRVVMSAALLACLAVGTMVARGKPANVSAVVTIDDSYMGTPRIRSEIGASYQDAVDCVQAWYATPKGNFFLRTVSSGCTPASREIVLDFGSPATAPASCDVDGLDVCSANSVADVRLIADRLFSATATNLSIPFSLSPDFRNTAFELDYQGSLAVTGSGSARTMRTDGNDVAELYRIGRTKTLIGRYHMPVRITVQAAP